MDKKSFVKGLFTGLGISLAGLIVAGGVIACNQKPVTTTPVVNKAGRDDKVANPNKASSTVNMWIIGSGSNWPRGFGSNIVNGIPFREGNVKKFVHFSLGDSFKFSNGTDIYGYSSFVSSLKGSYFGLGNDDFISVIKEGVFDLSFDNSFNFDCSLVASRPVYKYVGVPSSSVNTNLDGCGYLVSAGISFAFHRFNVGATGYVPINMLYLNGEQPSVALYSNQTRFVFDEGGGYSVNYVYENYLNDFRFVFDYLPNTLIGSFVEVVEYVLAGTSNNCSYSYNNNNDGTGYVDVIPDTGYSVDVNEWNDGTATFSGADYQRYMSLGDGVYRLYFTNISQDGWSATFNARPSATQTITYNLSHCSATPLTVPYGDLDAYNTIRITPDVGYSLKHVTPTYTGLVDSSHTYDWVYDSYNDVIDIYFNQVGVNPSVTCSAIEKVDVNYDGLEHCSLLDVSPSPLVGYESRWRFVPDDGYNFLQGLTSPSWSVTPVSSAGWSTEAGVGENEGKTILVCDATPNDGSMSFDIEASAGIPVDMVLTNHDGKEVCYTDDEPLYWINDNYRRLVTFHAKRGYRFVVPYIRTNVNVGLSYTLENGNKTLKVEYWNATNGVGLYQLSLMPEVGLEYEVIGLGSTNIDFGSAWRPIGYVDSNAGLYTGNALESNVLEYDSIVFSSNGKMYDKLRIVYKKIGNNAFFVDGVDINSDLHLAEFRYFDHLEYVNSMTRDTLVACSTRVDIVNESSSAGAGYAEVSIYPETLYWGNTALKSISIYFDDGTTYDTAIGVGTGLTASQILLNGANVTGGSSQGNTGNVGYGGTYDPFVLIATALGTATGFMGYMVLPGLTIGMLMLIPMIITLIIVVFRLVKK